jgi:hypothetical protein
VHRPLRSHRLSPRRRRLSTEFTCGRAGQRITLGRLSRRVR